MQQGGFLILPREAAHACTLLVHYLKLQADQGQTVSHSYVGPGLPQSPDASFVSEASVVSNIFVGMKPYPAEGEDAAAVACVPDVDRVESE